MRQVFLDRYLSRDPIVRLGLLLLASSVRRARRARGISQSALAAGAGLSPSTISKLENGRLEGMRLYTLARVMAALNVDLQLVDEQPADFIEIQPRMRHLATAVWLRAVRRDVDDRPQST